jgi:hypothetical protein
MYGKSQIQRILEESPTSGSFSFLFLECFIGRWASFCFNRRHLRTRLVEGSAGSRNSVGGSSGTVSSSRRTQRLAGQGPVCESRPRHRLGRLDGLSNHIRDSRRRGGESDSRLSVLTRRYRVNEAHRFESCRARCRNRADSAQLGGTLRPCRAIAPIDGVPPSGPRPSPGSACRGRRSSPPRCARPPGSRRRSSR